MKKLDSSLFIPQFFAVNGDGIPNLTDSFVLMTSYLGLKELSKAMFLYKRIKPQCMTALTKHF